MTNTFIGSVGSVELKYTPQNKPVLEVSFAENHSKRDQQGNFQDDGKPTWRRATLWEDKALSAANVIQKGDFIVVIGRERLREYEAKDGSTGKSLEVQAQWIAKIPPKLDTNSGPSNTANNAGGFNTAPSTPQGGDSWQGFGANSGNPQPNQSNDSQQEAWGAPQQSAPSWDAPNGEPAF